MTDPRANPESAHWLGQLAAGDDTPAAAIFDRYAQRLVTLARKRLSPKIARRVDADDVVQSAFRSFFLGARQGDFVWQRSGDLWSLLVKITLRKVYRAAEREGAAKRSVDREVSLRDSAGEGNVESIDREPTPVEVIALIEQVSAAIKQFDEPVRRVLELRLAGQSHVEISEQLGCSQRSIRRMIQDAHRQWEAAFADNSPRPAKAPIPIAEPRATLNYEDYLLEDYLGGGGMGRVYRAAERGLKRGVAIKALRKSWLGNRAAVEQFLREGELLSRLRHEHIVGFHGIGRFPSGGYFLVLDLVEGTTLADRLCDGPLPAADCQRFLLQAADAIGYAHRQGVVHGDLTPGNLLLDAHDKLYVSDFGLGRLLRDSDQTPLGGTRGYHAPEQLSREGRIDQRTDIYGLAAVWYAMLTGRAPHEAAASKSQEIAKPSSINPCLNEEVDQACLRALALRPEDRPQEVDDFVRLVRSVTSS